MPPDQQNIQKVREFVPKVMPLRGIARFNCFMLKSVR